MPLMCRMPLAASPQGLGTLPTTTMRRPLRFLASSTPMYWKPTGCLAQESVSGMVPNIGASLPGRAPARTTDRPHLAARRAATEEPVAAVGLEPRHLHSRWHVELLQHLAGLGIDPAHVAFTFFQRAVPELAIDPGHAGDEAVRFDRAQNL